MGDTVGNPLLRECDIMDLGQRHPSRLRNKSATRTWAGDGRPLCPQEFFQGGVGASGHGERGSRAHNGSLGRSPQRVPEAEPLVRESGGEVELKALKHLYASAVSTSKPSK